MSDIPAAAIEAAGEAIYDNALGYGVNGTQADNLARAAIEAAMPAIREAIWAQIQTQCDNSKANGMTGYAEGIRDAARIVRGGTP